MPDLSPPKIRPWRKTGKEFACTVCGKMFYRRASLIARGVIKTCGAPECKSLSMSGEHNPYWEHEHSPEMRERIKEGLKLAKPHRRKPGPPKGYKHTDAAIVKIKHALRERWRLNRDKMLAQFAHLKKDRGPEDKRHRHGFTGWQKREWTDTECLWCGDAENLVLDHIVPVMCGGTNIKENAQTLCQPCNLWKMVYVDRQLYRAGLGSKRGRGKNS